MLTRWIMAAAAVATLGLSGPATAQRAPEVPDLTHAMRGVSYYNLPGATWADHQAAVRDCVAIAANGYWGYGGGETDLHIDPVIAREGWFQGFIENCMVLKGWRVVRMNPYRAKDYGRYGPPALERLLTPWVGAEQPEGDIVRVFDNEAARADTVFWRRQAVSPPWTFSLRAVTDLRNLPQFPGAYEPPVYDAPRLPPWTPYFEPLTLEELGRIPPETAVVIARVRGMGRTAERGFSLARMAPGDELTARRITTLEPGDFAIFDTSRGIAALPEADRGDLWMAFPVTPGRYRINTRGNIGFCFGAPAVEVGAGEAVYLGDFNIGEGRLAPDMNLEPVQAWLQAAPAIAAKLRPAAWVNGSTIACKQAFAYVLEFPGYPFEPGYVRGVLPLDRWTTWRTRPQAAAE